MELHPATDKIMNPVLLRGDIWEPLETAIFIRLATNSKIVFDIGANIGWYTMIASKVIGDDGIVIAFEPQIDISLILSRNVMRNQLRNVEVLQMAVSDQEATAIFVTTPNHVGDHHLANLKAGETGDVVHVTTIDSQCTRINASVDLIKLDTQGAELAAFRGLKAQMRTGDSKPVIISEFWPHGMKRFGSDAGDYVSELEASGYEAFLIDHFVLRPISMSELRHRAKTDLAPVDLAYVDLVLIPCNDPRKALIESFISRYGGLERYWHFRLRPILAWCRRMMRRHTNI